MKYLFIFICFLGCCTHKVQSNLPMIQYNESQDTIRVSQTDSLQFSAVERYSYQHHKAPKLITEYELITPKIDVYYYIYNPKNLLYIEGTYEENQELNYTGFLNFKTYNYDQCNRLQAIFYYKDGSNIKTELFNHKGQLKKVLYFDEKSQRIIQEKYYRNGVLKKTVFVGKFGAREIVR